MNDTADKLAAAGVDSYLALEAKQQPAWPDADALKRVTSHLERVPPLVFAGEADVLRGHLAAAGRGDAFVLQGGDCAENFAESTADRIRNKIMTILQMSVILTYGASTPVVKIGRIAGQFAKPRSSDLETRGDVTLPAYRGDIINSSEFTLEARVPTLSGCSRRTTSPPRLSILSAPSPTAGSRICVACTRGTRASR